MPFPKLDVDLQGSPCSQQRVCSCLCPPSCCRLVKSSTHATFLQQKEGQVLPTGCPHALSHCKCGREVVEPRGSDAGRGGRGELASSRAEATIPSRDLALAWSDGREGSRYLPGFGIFVAGCPGSLGANLLIHNSPRCRAGPPRNLIPTGEVAGRRLVGLCPGCSHTEQGQGQP